MGADGVKSIREQPGAVRQVQGLQGDVLVVAVQVLAEYGQEFLAAGGNHEAARPVGESLQDVALFFR